LKKPGNLNKKICMFQVAYSIMADSKTEDEQSESTIRIPKEHAPLDYLLSQIPKKAQKGMLIQCDLHLNCIDANDHFIALGSNVGVVFLYNRKDKELERLRTHVR
jgi:hypothetical protein